MCSPNFGFDVKNVNRNSLSPLRNPQRDQSRHQEAPVLLAFQLRFIRLPKPGMCYPLTQLRALPVEKMRPIIYSRQTPHVENSFEFPFSLENLCSDFVMRR
ncbi:hypothetical protein TNCV_1967751 [Trichonephila clavipes]|nr:hypothetical protein TNCV_1967751 [Trichonephila clavipes]